MASLKILFICNKSPWPAKEGGPIAMSNLIDGLITAGNKIKVLAVNSDKYYINVSDIPAIYRIKTDIEFVHIDLNIKAIPAFFNLFSRQSYHVQRFISKVFEEKLIEILIEEDFDIVQMETLFMAPYIDVIRKYSEAKILLRAHNIEHLIWKRMYLTCKNPLKKFYLHHLFTTLENYEKAVLNRFDGILPITEKDAGFFKSHCQKPVQTMPFGVNLENYPLHHKQQPENALFHIGAMNWMPNEEGIRWFLKEVWPKVRVKFPGLKLYLAGRAMSRWLSELNEKNVMVMGEIPDACDFILSKSISIAPLFSGSGVRIKIVESMCLGKAVISTKTGAEGIEYTDGKNILLAGTAEDFVSAIARLYENPKEAVKLGKNARRLMEVNHDNRKIIEQLKVFYQEIL
jgi:glycosyltransferase involved in cell wall biosynthesis